MSTSTDIALDQESTDPRTKPRAAGSLAKKRLTNRWATLAALLIAAMWTIPTFGLVGFLYSPGTAGTHHRLVDDLPELGIHHRKLFTPCCRQATAN